MLKKALSCFRNSFNDRAYKIVKPSFFKSEKIADIIYRNGYYITDFLSKREIEKLKKSYSAFHLNRKGGEGAFFGEISKEIHNANAEILSHIYDEWFVNYKSIVNAFVVKTPGAASVVPIHQDSASVDEEKYSSINLWIPLEDISAHNGVMYVIPKSHHIFLPYRCATIDPISKNIEHVLLPYFIPLFLKAGQALIFDSRLFHYSSPNLTNETRVVAISKICSQEAKVIAYFRDNNANHNKVEVWQCPDDYLIYSESHNDTIRPRFSKQLGYKNPNVRPLTESEFEKRRKTLKIELPCKRPENERQIV